MKNKIIPDKMENSLEKGCLHCGITFTAKRADTTFCGDTCRKAYDRLPVKERYLNAPIVDHLPLKHGDLFTSHGQEIQLDNGILRVRLRYEDPEVLKEKAAAKEAKAKETGEEGNKRASMATMRPKRRGA
jgi:hypothetical protein